MEADPNLDVIEFKQFQPKAFFIEPKETNYYNTTEFTVRVGKGDCVLFPSMTHHAVPEVKSEKTRISLAFNSFFEGKIGLADDGVNYLEINNVK
jgi:ectoine hydroxylase-related dioxygenase (phytanoyl-CoA dioxygenase family)